MIIEPKFRGFICTTAHPEGCARHVEKQIEYLKKQQPFDGPKNVLVIGASTGYGLASRITAAFGSEANTLGVFYERPASGKRTATPGWYNTAAFERAAEDKGLYAKSINGDAFSNEIKQKTIAQIKVDLGQVDLVIYSLASPRRTDPESGETYTSVIKPIDKPFSGKTVDFHTGDVSTATIEPATDEEIADTVKVMGGEDWRLWMESLQAANVLTPNCTTIAYSYIGPEVTHPIYRDGTIGKAKEDLEACAEEINGMLGSLNGKAYVSINKALVTQSSAAIPVVPLYISLLYQVMKEKGIHEGCIEQIYRLFSTRLYGESLELDAGGRIRIDDWEMREDVQVAVSALWEQVTSENIESIADLVGYREEFFQLFGFGQADVDYDQEVDPDVKIPSID